jgi:predicted DNA-binding protein YlxM (UPF0122 family)
MGFADLSILEIAEDYQLSPDAVMALCDRLKIRYETPNTRLPLEDAKAVIEHIVDASQHPDHDR